MRSAIVVGSAALALMLGASPAGASAQSVIISNRSIYQPVNYTAPVRAVAVDRAWPRVIVVARIDLGGRGRGRGHAYGRADDRGWRSAGYRPVTVYYVDGRYYDRWDVRYRGRNVRQVVVYQRGGRYYRDWDDNGYDSRNDRYGQDDRYDRNDRNDRYNDRYDDRDGRSDRRDDRGRYGR
jgi:hypothetical protein